MCSHGIFNEMLIDRLQKIGLEMYYICDVRAMMKLVEIEINGNSFSVESDPPDGRIVLGKRLRRNCG